MKAIITGSTNGIGKETAIKMAKLGYDLILPVRSMEKGEKLKVEIQKNSPSCQIYLYECDFADLDSVINFVNKLETEQQISQVLINNVGIWNKTKELTKQGFEATFGVNHLSIFLTTDLILKKNLLQPESDPTNSQNSDQTKARIVNLSSMGHYFAKVNWSDLQFEKNKYDFNLAYYNSKLFNVLFTQKLATNLVEINPNITCNSLHPGIVNTSLLVVPSFIRKLFGWLIMTPEKGSENTIFVATDKSLENTTGKYFDNFKVKKHSQQANLENQEKLWQISEKLLSKYL